MKSWVEQQLGEEVLEIVPTENGSGATYTVNTLHGRYIAKRGERQDFLALYKKAVPMLEAAGLKQSHVVAHCDQMVLYEWIAGDTCKTLTDVKIKNAILYMKKYFDTLRRLPLEEVNLVRQNAWDDAKSLDFLLDDFPETGLFLLSPCLADATARLSGMRESMAKMPKQLIHGDLGADNFLFRGDTVTSIIDFTPEIASEFYGLCQFLYWNVLWQEESAASLRAWAKLYSEKVDEELFDCFMLQAALYRVAGPLLNGCTNVDKRIKLLELLLEAG